MYKFDFDLNLMSDKSSELLLLAFQIEVLQKLDEKKTIIKKDPRAYIFNFYPQTNDHYPFKLAFSTKEIGSFASMGIGSGKQTGAVFTHEDLNDLDFFEYAKNCLITFLKSRVIKNNIYLHDQMIGGNYIIENSEIEVLGFGKRKGWFWQKKYLSERQEIYEPWIT